ncbi:MAG TPA: RluA family pseudouridine synthase [Virgibacillus sp.]|nr:RluA family pseudouridine synthase [Virgibacillus sp.]
MKIPIIYEDNHLLVVEKPVNMPVQEDRSGDKDLLTLLKEKIKIRDQKPGNVYLALVHRLDRPVGGVMVFAKTSKAASRLSDVIRRNKLNRTYLAVVRGKPKTKQQKLTHYLKKDRRKNMVRAVSRHDQQAKKAILEYETLGSLNGLSLLSIRLHTGRSHQIRVQLSTIGLPIYGDQRYGQEQKPGEQIALWAHELAFPHTTTKDILSFISEPPNTYPWNTLANFY